MMFKHKKRGQTTLEYAILLIIIIGVFVGMQNYFKRALQGRWKGHIDELGDQYDPRVADTNVIYTMSSVVNTEVIAMNTASGWWTRRTDSSTSTERKTGYDGIGSY